MGARPKKQPPPRTLPMLALPCRYASVANRAAHATLAGRLAARQCLPPQPPVPPMAPGLALEPGSASTADAPGPAFASVWLVMSLSDPLSLVLRDHFAESHWRVHVCQDTARAERLLDSQSPGVVILDYGLADAQALVDGMKLSPTYNPVPVLALFPQGCDPEHPPGLRIRADVELAEPFELARLIAIAQTRAARTATVPAYDELSLRLVLPSTPSGLDHITELATVLFRHCGLDATNQSRLLAAFREAVGNAIQHGSRRDPSKAVRVEFHQDAGRVTIAVEDDGDGFDHRRFLKQAMEKEAVDAARRRHEEGGQGGLGILMIHRCADHIEFSDTGNAVTFTKLILPPDTPDRHAARPATGPSEQNGRQSPTEDGIIGET